MKPFIIPEKVSKTVHVAYDIGSGGIKVTAARVNEQTATIEEVLLERRLAVQFARDMRMNNGFFSSSVTNLAIQEINLVKEAIAKRCEAVDSVTHTAVATAAFRQAKNGNDVAKQISTLVGFNVHIINCNQEGLLAFQSAKTKFSTDMVVFDLGGGSVQFTGQLNTTTHVRGIPFGVETFTGAIQTYLEEPTTKPLNPFNEGKYQLALGLATKIIHPYIQSMGNIESLIRSGATVVGIGAVHNVAIYPIIEKTLGKDASYSAANLENTILQLLNKTDQELAEVEPNPNFAQILLPTLIFNLALMKALNINEINPINVGNTLGLLTDGIPRLSSRQLLKP